MVSYYGLESGRHRQEVNMPDVEEFHLAHILLDSEGEVVEVSDRLDGKLIGRSVAFVSNTLGFERWIISKENKDRVDFVRSTKKP